MLFFGYSFSGKKSYDKGQGVKEGSICLPFCSGPLFLKSLSQAPHSPHLPQRPATSRYLILKPSECRSHLAGPRTARTTSIYTLKGSMGKKVAEQPALLFLKEGGGRDGEGERKKVRNMPKPLHISHIHTYNRWLPWWLRG